MKRRTIVLVLLALGLFISGIGAGVAYLQGGYVLSWVTVSGGGGVIKGGDYTLAGALGQATSGDLGGGAYMLDSGFWIEALSFLSTFLPMVFR